MDTTEIVRRLKGYHLVIHLYPAGGFIDAEGCEECGTDEDVIETAMFRYHRGECIGSAVDKIERKLRRLSNDGQENA